MLDRTPFAATARGAVAGALAGASAGLVDYLLARSGAAQFLPDGSGRLALFLLAAYAAAATFAGALVGGLFGILVRLTDLGPLLRLGFHDHAAAAARRRLEPPVQEHEGASWAAYAVALVLGFALLGLALHTLTLTALLRFHHHLLIAALVGAVGTALALPLAILVIVVARLLGALIRRGARPSLAWRAAPAWLALFWTLGLLIAAGAILVLTDRLQFAPRMTAEHRAVNVAMWGPILLGGALVLAHLVGRLAWRLLPGGLRGRLTLLDRPSVALLLPALLGLLAAGGAMAAAWPLVKLLPWRPFIASGAGISVFLIAALAGVGRRADLRPRAAAALALVVGLALAAFALQIAGAERVRKAAIAHAGLAGPLLVGLDGLTDFDRDGFSAILGSDCNDLDPEVHPGAFDWPDDGVDQNCNGHQATARPAPRHPFAPVPQAVPERPNVLFISVDALRADHLGAYGYARPTTPRLDRLVAEGTLFRAGWAHSPSTRYSVPAMLIGRYESTIAWGSPAQHWPPPVLPENRLLSEMFKEHGYRTAAFLPYHYFERAWGLDQGFDDYDSSLSRLHANPFNGDPARTTGSSSKELADTAISWIQAHRDQPFFLWTHFYDPHYLYEAHAEAPDFGPSDLDRYDNEIAFTDHHIGRLLDGLREAGLWERTVIIVTADHGESLGEHGINQHGYHIYVQQNKVPFIVRVPGIPPRVVEEAVGHVDLFPSLLNLLRAPDEPQLLGRSFVDLMLGSSGERRLVYGEVEYEGPVVRKAVLDREYHLIHNVIPDNTVELYHLTADPQESRDLAGAGSEPEERLRAALGEWMDQAALPADFSSRVTGNLSPGPLPFSTPLAADLGLLVVDGVDPPKATARPNDRIELAVVMHAPKAIPPGWKLFTHATPSDGRFLNLDHQPVEGFVPLQKLKAGQYVRDWIRFSIPPHFPAGPLRVELGLFKGSERAKVRSAQAGGAGDHVLLATIQIER